MTVAEAVITALRELGKSEVGIKEIIAWNERTVPFDAARAGKVVVPPHDERAYIDWLKSEYLSKTSEERSKHVEEEMRKRNKLARRN